MIQSSCLKGKAEFSFTLMLLLYLLLHPYSQWSKVLEKKVRTSLDMHLIFNIPLTDCKTFLKLWLELPIFLCNSVYFVECQTNDFRIVSSKIGSIALQQIFFSRTYFLQNLPESTFLSSFRFKCIAEKLFERDVLYYFEVMSLGRFAPTYSSCFTLSPPLSPWIDKMKRSDSKCAFSFNFLIFCTERKTLSFTFCILRFKCDSIFSRDLIVEMSGEIPEVDFRRCLDVPDQSQRRIFACKIFKKVEVSF